MSNEKQKQLKVKDIRECARQALFFLDEQNVREENLIYKNAAKQFVQHIVRLIPDARDSVQSTSSAKSSK